jgi:hypothetical protein
MKETIFYLEERGSMYLFHFFIYNLGGLYYIENKIYDKRGDDAILFEDKNKVVETPTNEVTYPIKIYIKNPLPFQKEALHIIKDKFQLIEDLNDISDYEIISIYGETIFNNAYGDNSDEIYPFIRNLFRERINYNVNKKKRIFITRKNSEKYHNGVLKRYLKNEHQFKNMLYKYNIEFIQLEDFNTHDKIKLFMESELIISTHSGALTMLLFVNKNAKIIEILNNGTLFFVHDHYYNISEKLDLNYIRYTNILEDENGNFELNINEFENFLYKFI